MKKNFEMNTDKNKTVFFKNKYVIFSAIIMLFALSIISFATASAGEIDLSLVNQDPDPAIAGDVVELRLGIQNNGDSTLENLMVELISGYPFQIAPGEDSSQNVGTISPYQGYSDDNNIKTIKFKILVDDSATAGSYDIQFKVYELGSSDAVTKTLTVDLKNRENAEIIYIDKTVLVPGKQTALKFTINNVGNSPLRDLTFSWENSDMTILPVGSDNTKYVKSIAVGESQELEYQVIADTNADPGLYKLDLTLTYDDSMTGEETTVSTIAGVYIGGETDFDVALSETSGTTTSFSVANIGSNPAYSVSIIIPEQSGWKTSGANSMIIGNLNTGDYTVASFKLQQSQSMSSSGVGTRNSNSSNSQNSQSAPQSPQSNQPSSSQSKNLIIQIAYTDTMGSRNFVNKTVDLSSQSSGNSTMSGMPNNFRGRNQSSSTTQYVWYGIGAVILILLAVLYFKYRREKLINPSFKMKDLFKKQQVKKK